MSTNPHGPMHAWDKDRFQTNRVSAPDPTFFTKPYAAAAAAEQERYAPSKRSTPETESIERHANDVQMLVAALLAERDQLKLRIANLEEYIQEITETAHHGLKVIAGQLGRNPVVDQANGVDR